MYRLVCLFVYLEDFHKEPDKVFVLGFSISSHRRMSHDGARAVLPLLQRA